MITIHEGTTQSAGVSRGYVAPATITASGVDFKSLLLGLFNETDRVLKDSADDSLTSVSFKGLGTYDKNNAAFWMVSSIYLSRIENQVNSEMGYVEFILKTAPSILQKAM